MRDATSLANGPLAQVQALKARTMHRLQHRNIFVVTLVMLHLQVSSLPFSRLLMATWDFGTS